ncbi:MAG: sensor histidine kinase [Byssovorax sp.]
MSRPHRRSRAALRRELRTRDAFLGRFSEMLSLRVRALVDAPGAESIEGLQSFARELAIIAGDREARIPRRATLDVGAHVQQVIEEMMAQHTGRTDASPPKVEVERAPDLVASVDGDQVAILLGELLSNAYKYGRGRPIRVLVEGEPDRVRIVVEDQGPGFTPTSGLGQRFVRGADTERMRGFGVGLWLMNTLAKAHGGALTFAPRSGGGTRVMVTLLRLAP